MSQTVLYIALAASGLGFVVIAILLARSLRRPKPRLVIAPEAHVALPAIASPTPPRRMARGSVAEPIASPTLARPAMSAPTRARLRPSHARR